MGLAPLYYHVARDRIWFADRLPALIKLAALPRHLDPAAFAQLGLGTKRDERCFTKGARKAGAAQAMLFDGEGGMRRLRYWDPGEAPDIRYASDAEYREAFVTLYDDAVACQLGGPGRIGIALSGGLDSGSIAALAAPRLAARGSRLPAYSWVPDPELGGSTVGGRKPDELNDVRLIAGHVGNIDVTPVPGYRTDVLGALRWMLAVTDDLSNPLAGWSWFHNVLARAGDDGIGTLLTGDFGNLTVSREFGVARTKPWQKMRDEAGKRWRAWKGGRARHMRLLVRPDFVRHTLRHVEPTDPELNARWQRAEQPLKSIYNLLHGSNLTCSREFAAAFGYRIAAPTVDRRIVDFCLGIPPDQHARGEEKRILIRHSFAGKLPHGPLWNPIRGLPGSDLRAALASQHDEVTAILEWAARSPIASEALDLRRLNTFAAALAPGAKPLSPISAGFLVRGLAYAMFLQTFEDVGAA